MDLLGGGTSLPPWGLPITSIGMVMGNIRRLTFFASLDIPGLLIQSVEVEGVGEDSPVFASGLL